MSRWALTPRRLLTALLPLALFVLSAQPSLDGDLWWHLRTGQWIVEQRAVPHVDPFSFTKLGEHWVAHEWLADVALYALYQTGGLVALTLAASVVITLTFLIVYHLSELRPHLAVFTTLLAALASAVTWGPRPQMLTLLFAALTLLIVQRAHQTATRVLWLLPPLFILWANVHSGFFVGLVILGAEWAGELLEHLSASPRGMQFATPLSEMAKWLGRIFILCILAATINPNGFELLVYPLFTLTSQAMQTYIIEWHSPDFHDPRFLPFAALLLVLIVTFALSSRRPTVTELLLLVGLGYEALLFVRNIPLFAIVAAPTITRQIAMSLRSAEPLPSPCGGMVGGEGEHSNRSSRPRLALNWLLLIIIVLAALARVSTSLSDTTSLARNFPVAAADYLSAAQPDGPMLNSYNFGGYLIWRLYPTYQVFIDGRADVYGDAFMDEYYARAWQGRGDWQAYLDRFNIRLVVMEKGGALSSLLRGQPQWRLVHEDQLATVFERP